MEIVQQNQCFTLAEVDFAEVCGSCGSSKNKPMESMTYLRKFVAEVPPISRKGKCRETLLQVASLFLGRLRGGLGV